MNLRPYRSSDLPSLNQICLQTGASGGDGSDRCTHPELVGSFYAAPYPAFDTKSCLILEDGEGPCGYVLGTFDSRAFANWFNQSWLPQLRERFRGLVSPPEAFDGWILESLDRQMEVPDFVDDYPAHLHIDLLPRVQRGGWGRKMVMAWADLATARGARGLHLGVSGRNLNAVAFYRHIGMHEITAEDWGFHMGMKLGG